MKLHRIIVFCAATYSASLFAADAALNQNVSQVKQSVLELNQALYQLEKDLLSPTTTQVSFYLSLTNGRFFEPLAIEIKAADLPAAQHIYTERQVQALRMGAVQPLLQDNLGPGKHLVRVSIRGRDGQQREQILELAQEVEKTASPLMLEIAISDDPEHRQAKATLKVW